MTPELLQRFCAKPEHEIRLFLHAPLRRFGRLFAANGHILVSVPDIPGLASGEDTTIDRFITDLQHGITAASNYVRLADILPLPETAECHCCNGKRHMTACPDCGGNGEFDNGELCSRCDGAGYWPSEQGEECWHCEGAGHDPHQTVRVGLGRFARRYLALLTELPDVELATNPENPEKDVAYFRFTGGWGALMPCRESRRLP